MESYGESRETEALAGERVLRRVEAKLRSTWNFSGVPGAPPPRKSTALFPNPGGRSAGDGAEVACGRGVVSVAQVGDSWLGQ